MQSDEMGAIVQGYVEKHKKNTIDQNESHKGDVKAKSISKNKNVCIEEEMHEYQDARQMLEQMKSGHNS